MQRKHWKRAIAATLTSLATAAWGTPMLFGQTGESALSVPAGLQNMTAASSGPIQHLPFAHFNIPFEIDPSGPLPREVHLWVSPDQGRSWLKYASTNPEKRSFEFHAAAEGEYLFAVQTQDSQGDSTLAAAPPMRIRIDTTEPEVQLTVDVGSAGQLIIDYHLSDPFLSQDSVRLAYSVDGLGQWEDVRMGTLSQIGSSWAGRAEIAMPRCRELEVRVTATDLAQNKAEKIIHFNAPRTAAANSGVQLASQRGDQRGSDPNAWISAAPRQPLHSAQRSPQGQAGGAYAALMPSNRPSSASNPNPALGLAGPMLPSAGLVASQGAVAWNPSDTGSSRTMTGWSTEPSQSATRTIATQPGLKQPAQPESAARLAAAPSPAYEELPRPTPLEDSSTHAAVNSELQLSHSASDGSPVTEKVPDRQLPVARRELANIDLGAASASPNSAPVLDAAPSLNIDRASEPSAGKPLDSQASAYEAPADDTVGGTPAGNTDPYHSRSRTFSLDYAVDSMRGAAVSDIELWGTEDQGRTWQKWGSDPDRQSPFDVQVGNDGLFGFRMVIIGSNGLISNRPESGDPADMWINVDTETPSVNITRALYGEGQQAGSLVIEFTGTDDNLHDRPVTLSYSERPTGPWVTITSGLPATGQYVWKPDAGLPRQVFLRAQAVDRAGNTQEHRLDLPVNLRGMAPQGRIQGFRPIAN